MGTFYVDCTAENVADPKRLHTVAKVLVDTGSEYTWLPSAVLEGIGVTRQKEITFVMANGENVTRHVGFAIVRAQGFFTVDEVVFGENHDLNLLGARSLEGFNARVDSHAKRLVAAGPVVAAAARVIDPNSYPEGWGRRRVEAVIAHYDKKSEEEAIAEADDTRFLRQAKSEEKDAPMVKLSEMRKRLGLD